MGDSQLKAIRELATIFDAETKIPNRYALSTPTAPLMKKITKLPRVEDQTDPPPRVDPGEESKDREHNTSQSNPDNSKTISNKGKIHQKVKGTSEATPPWPLQRK